MERSELRGKSVHMPMRTCLSCRKRQERSSLLRFVASTEGLLFDLRQRLPGRGAYVCALQSCFEGAVERKRFGRALRIPDLPTPDVQVFWNQVSCALDGRPNAADGCVTGSEKLVCREGSV